MLISPRCLRLIFWNLMRCFALLILFCAVLSVSVPCSSILLPKMKQRQSPNLSIQFLKLFLMLLIDFLNNLSPAERIQVNRLIRELDLYEPLHFFAANVADFNSEFAEHYFSECGITCDNFLESFKNEVSRVIPTRSRGHYRELDKMKVELTPNLF